MQTFLVFFSYLKFIEVCSTVQYFLSWKIAMYSWVTVSFHVLDRNHYFVNWFLFCHLSKYIDFFILILTSFQKLFYFVVEKEFLKYSIFWYWFPSLNFSQMLFNSLPTQIHTFAFSLFLEYTQVYKIIIKIKLDKICWWRGRACFLS